MKIFIIAVMVIVVYEITGESIMEDGKYVMEMRSLLKLMIDMCESEVSFSYLSLKLAMAEGVGGAWKSLFFQTWSTLFPDPT